MASPRVAALNSEAGSARAPKTKGVNPYAHIAQPDAPGTPAPKFTPAGPTLRWIYGSSNGTIGAPSYTEGHNNDTDGPGGLPSGKTPYIAGTKKKPLLVRGKGDVANPRSVTGPQRPRPV